MESHVHSDRDCDKVTSVCFSWCHQHILDTGHVGGASVPVHRAMRLGIPIRDKATRGRKKISPYDPRSLPSLGRIRAPRMRRLVFFFFGSFSRLPLERYDSCPRLGSKGWRLSTPRVVRLYLNRCHDLSPRP